MGTDSFIGRIYRAFCYAGIALILVFLATASAPGQGTAQDRAALLGNQANPLFPQAVSPSGEAQGYAVATPSDQDVGQQQILKRTEEYQPLTILIGSPVYYTSNVALVRKGAQDDLIIAPVVNVIYQPQISKTLYGEFALQQQLFFYNRLTEFNFASFDAIVGLVYYMPRFHNIMLRARYDYNRLTDIDHFDEFFVDHSFFLNAELPFQLDRAQLLSIGVDADLSFYGHPGEPRRNDYEGYAAYTVNLSRSFSINAVGRLAVRDYYQGGRTDISEIIALSANYRVRDWLTASVISTFAWNQSNRDVFDYSVANVGAGVAFTVKL